MLKGLQILQERLSNVDIANTVMYMFEQNSDLIIRLVQLQLELGKDGDNQDVTLYGKSGYSPFTVKIKEEFGDGIGSIVDVITNYMSGGFYKSLSFNPINENEFEIVSSSLLEPKIKVRSGEKIINLNKISANILCRDYIQPALSEYIKSLFYAD